MFSTIMLIPVAESYFASTNYDLFLSCPHFHNANRRQPGTTFVTGLLPPTTASM